MSRVLSGRDLERLEKFLATDARHFDEEYNLGAADPYSKILAWAQEPDHGGLPERSARAFADWLSGVWADWTEEPITVKDVLEGAVTEWCGGRVMPS